MKEAAFGPGLPIHTLFITGTLAAEDKDLRGLPFFFFLDKVVTFCFSFGRIPFRN